MSKTIYTETRIMVQRLELSVDELVTEEQYKDAIELWKKTVPDISLVPPMIIETRVRNGSAPDIELISTK